MLFFVAGSDYVAVSESVTFGSGAGDRQCINIPILRDTLNEFTENFDVVLDLPGPGVIPGTPETARVFIESKKLSSRISPQLNF